MKFLIDILPLPIEIINIIASYDRVLSIKPISKTDYRYNLLLDIPPKKITYYADTSVRGWLVRFSTRYNLLSMFIQENYEDIYTYINVEYDDRCEMYLWK
jgi:hypothetical protein